ncbi:hypothetical protein CBS101457_000499 [Exobasidium rhododendri]|nr:hypothetical protein CBS101457_000499 [Exobasidium rhododendri]
MTIDSSTTSTMEMDKQRAESSTPKSFESWRLSCEAITGLSRYPKRTGESSRSVRYPIYSVSEAVSQTERHVGREREEYHELEEMLQNYQETDEEKKSKGLVEQWKNELLRTSPMIRFMSKHLTLISCSPHNETVGPNTTQPPILIACCPPDLAGGFSPSFPGRPHSESGIMICANRVFSKQHLEDTMAHEMIHWWDHCRFNVDWNNLRHHACTEIRAAVLSGDCSWSREFKRRNYAFSKQFQTCARRRAVLSVEGNPNCPDKKTAERAVDEVWESCFNDSRPFDRPYPE